MATSSPAHAAPGFLSRRTWPVLAAGLALTGLVGSGLSDHGTARRAAAEPVPVTQTQTQQQRFGAPLAEQLTTGPGSSAPSTGTANTPPAARHTADPAPASGLAADGIPTTALTAYRAAATREAALRPGCGLPWTLLAAIGRIESDHGRFAGAVLHADGLSTPAVIGIPLDGHGTALIRDTDHGRLDGDTVYDRAVGPMQFIPSTWASWGVDGNHDGRRDPFNIIDAAPAAADYLCAAGGDLRTVAGQTQAVLSYNHSDAYVAAVLALEKAYAAGLPGVAFPIPGTDPGPGTARPTLPPVDPAPGHRGTSRTPTSTSGTRTAPSSAGSATTSPAGSPSTSPSASPSGCPTSSTTAPATSSSSSSAPSSSAPSSSAPPSSAPASPTASGCPTTPTPDPSTSGATGGSTAAGTAASGAGTAAAAAPTASTDSPRG